MQKVKILSYLFNILLITVCLIPIPKSAPTPFTRTDLVVHLASYIIVSFLFLISYRKILLVTILFIAQGILIEVIQPFVNRHFEWLDIMANTSGVLIGLLSWKLISKTKFRGDLPE